MAKPKKIICEVCVETIDDAMRAEQAGADRIELCADLAVGGTTPSAGLIERVVQHVTVPVMVMIRPRPGDFCFGSRDLQTMLCDVRYAIAHKVSGIVIGALTADQQIDRRSCQAILAEAAGCQVTFHRAFDLLSQPMPALETLIELGIHRVLTSGQQPSAQAGIPRLRDLIERAGPRISVMPGAGVNEQNVSEILRETKAQEIHFSGRQIGQSVESEFAFGERFATDANRVSRICEEVRRFTASGPR